MRNSIILMCIFLSQIMVGCSEPITRPTATAEPVLINNPYEPELTRADFRESGFVINQSEPVIPHSTPEVPIEDAPDASIQPPPLQPDVLPDLTASPEAPKSSEPSEQSPELTPTESKTNELPAESEPPESQPKHEVSQPDPLPESEKMAEPEVPLIPEETPEELEKKAEQEALSKLPPFYARWTNILKTYVDENGNVDYNTLRRKRGDIIELTRLLNELDPQQVLFWSQDEKKALWINAHNIFTIKLIVDNYPIKPNVWGIWYPSSSIMQISGGRDKVYFKVMDIEYTLREIEREILLKRFDDPRICFTLSYASMGGAYLRNEPYYPHRLDRQLEDQTRRFIQSPRGAKTVTTESVLYLSDIFVWYKDVLIKHYGEIKKFRDRPDDVRSYLNCILPFLKPEDVSFIETQNPTVKYLKYDWQLNDKP